MNGKRSTRKTSQQSNAKELEERVVEGEMSWEGEVWKLQDNHNRVVMWFHTKQEVK